MTGEQVREQRSMGTCMGSHAQRQAGRGLGCGSQFQRQSAGVPRLRRTASPTRARLAADR